MMQEIFPVGATYAPLPKATEVDPSEWPRDLENFAKLGLNTFRLFLCWDRIEREPGKRDFSRVDLAFDLAARNHLRVIVNVGGTFTNLQAIYPPRHLVYDEHCTLLKPKPDSDEELRFNRFKLCYDDPRYQELAREFLHEAIARYKDRPELLAWSGWNEPRLAECFCRHTVALYRKWLERKYGDLETLAKAWSTEFPVRFRTWEDVNPQPEASFEAGGYAPFLDWQKFLAENRTAKFNLVRSWIREVDPVTPVISHLCGPSDADIFGEEEILGTSVYTIHAQGKSATGFSPYEFVSRQNLPFITEGRRRERRDPEGFWVVETEAGPVSWVHDLVPRSYSPRQMNARDLFYTAHGARAILRWLYRSRISDAQAGEFNLVGWDGRITKRAEEFGRLARFLQENTTIFSTHTAEFSGVAILDPRDCDAIAFAEGYRGRYNDAILRLYNALLHIGVRAEFRNTRQLREDALELDGIRVLFLPFRPCVDPWMAEKLRAFVEAGGVVIAESPFALKNTTGIHYEITPGLMTDLFGVQVFDLEKLKESTCGALPAYDFKAVADPKGGNVEATFADGTPAIITNRYGKGGTVLYLSQVSAAYQIEKPFYPNDIPVISYEDGQTFRNELSRRLSAAGIAPGWEFEEIDREETRKYLQIFRRNLPDGRKLLFVLNMDEKPHCFSLHFPGIEQLATLGSSSEEERPALGSRTRFDLAPWGWAVLTGVSAGGDGK